MFNYLKIHYDIFILYFLGLIVAFYLAILIYNLECFSFEKDCFDYYLSKNVVLPICRKVVNK